MSGKHIRTKMTDQQTPGLDSDEMETREEKANVKTAKAGAQITVRSLVCRSR
jgi:hypothetical protein